MTATRGTATQASSGWPRRRTTRNTIGPATSTYRTRKATSQPRRGTRSPASLASDWPTKPLPKRAAGSPVTAHPVGSTSPGHCPAAMAPAVSLISPRPAGDRPSWPGCHGAGKPSTVWPRSASTSRWPPCSTHARRAVRVAAGSRTSSSAAAAMVLTGPRLAGAWASSAGPRAAKRAVPASTASGAAPGTDRPPRAPGRRPTSSWPVELCRTASPVAMSVDPSRRRACTPTAPSKRNDSQAGRTTKNSLLLPPGTSTGSPTGGPSAVLTSSRPRTRRSAVTCTRTAMGRPGTYDPS